MLEIERRSEAKTKREALRNDTEEKVENAQKIMDFESLTGWKIEIERKSTVL